jgi:hypothetical protein
MMRSRLLDVVLAAIVGAAGGLGCSLSCHIGLLAGPATGAIFGAVFGALFRGRYTNPGAGIIWGLGYAFLLWLSIPAGVLPVLRGAMPSMGMLDTARDHFPELISYIVCLGVPLGFALGLFSVLRAPKTTGGFSVSRALVVGGFAGVVGGVVFGRWTGSWYFPLLGRLLGSANVTVGEWLHYIFSVVMGASFGLLFQKDIRGLGSSLGWGAAYGMMWWFLGPLTLFRLAGGHAIDWSYQNAQDLFGPFVGYTLFGLIAGLVLCVH